MADDNRYGGYGRDYRRDDRPQSYGDYRRDRDNRPSDGFAGPYRDESGYARGGGFGEDRGRYGDRFGGRSQMERADYGRARDDYDRSMRRDYEDFRQSRDRRYDPDQARYGQRGPSSASGLEIFDKSLQTTHIWLNEIVDEIGPDKQIAWHALTAVLRTIRDRVPIDLAAHLGAQLPMIVRGAYYDQFRPSADIERTRSLDDFLDSIADHMRGIGRPLNPLDAAHAVFRTLTRHISDGQIRKIIDAMPEQVRRSWEDACSTVRGPEERAAEERYR